MTEEVKKKVWNKATVVDGLSPVLYRKDPCGALISWTQYGNNLSPMGWEIDHICPKSMLEAAGYGSDEIDVVDNLRAMHYENNRSKGDNYPSYTACVTAEGNTNVRKIRNLKVNDSTRKILQDLYKI